ncbi:MAG: ferric reductase-like transmembrane domain-containing protein [Candidatus Falkowbacteria bacterium]|nr:MAG: ferric reductase-like transmembrane domain-containing protein [Candidatus Falkowbacteria bacterium]
MIQNIKKAAKRRFLGWGFLLCSLFFLGQALAVAAQTSSPDNYVKDSDYDGLSDQAEVEVYHSDPSKVDTDADGYLDAAEILSGSDVLNPSDPAAALAGQLSESEESKAPSSVPWYITRAAGISAYLLMFLIVVLGAGMTTGYLYKYLNPVRSWLTHKYLSLAMFLVLLAHMTALLFDNFINLRLKDILIPFASDFSPWFLSLGILGFYILLAVIFTSIWFRLKYKRAWRSVHYFVYVLFTFSFVHGLFLGTDSQTLAMRLIYISTSSIFVFIIIYRFIISRIKNRSYKQQNQYEAPKNNSI